MIGVAESAVRTVTIRLVNRTAEVGTTATVVEEMTITVVTEATAEGMTDDRTVILTAVVVTIGEGKTDTMAREARPVVDTVTMTVSDREATPATIGEAPRLHMTAVAVMDMTTGRVAALPIPHNLPPETMPMLLMITVDTVTAGVDTMIMGL